MQDPLDLQSGKTYTVFSSLQTWFIFEGLQILRSSRYYFFGAMPKNEKPRLFLLILFSTFKRRFLRNTCFSKRVNGTAY